MGSTYKVNDKTFTIDDGRDYTETYNAPEPITAALAYKFFEDCKNDILIDKALKKGTTFVHPPERKSYYIYGKSDKITDGITALLKVDSRNNSSLLDVNEGGFSLETEVNGGSLTVLKGSRLVDLGDRTGNWTIAVNSGRAWSNLPKVGQSAVGKEIIKALTAGGNTIFTSQGENHVTVTGAQNLIGLGEGKNYLLSQGQDTVYGQNVKVNKIADESKGEDKYYLGTTYGTDFVTIKGGKGTYDLGQNASVDDAASVGSMISVKANSSISGGSGSRVRFDNAGGTGTISGTVGDTISAAGNLSVIKGQNQSIDVTGALSFLNGTGNTTLAGGDNSTIWGANGLNATASMAGRAIFVANQPGAMGDQSYDASGSSGNLEYWSGPGKSSFTGGKGNDHFVFGTRFEGTSGDTFTTVKGGAGADSFGVLSGHSGGKVTIKDFTPSEGDFFFQYFYNPADATRAARNLLATAEVSGGNTTLHLDNNMQVTFLGVENLDASAIHIS